MKLSKILFQEAIRSIALGWILFMVISLLYRSDIVSLQAAWQIPLVFMGVIFVGFSLARPLTGRDFMIRTRKGWIVLALLTNGFLLLVVIIAKLMGLEDSILPYGIWPYLAVFILVGFLTWGSYRASKLHPNGGEDA